MVTTRSQGPAEATGTLPLRSRNFATTAPSTSSSPRTQTQPGSKQPSTVPRSREHSIVNPTADDETRSPPADHPLDAARETRLSVPDLKDQDALPRVSALTLSEYRGRHSNVGEDSLNTPSTTSDAQVATNQAARGNLTPSAEVPSPVRDASSGVGKHGRRPRQPRQEAASDWDAATLRKTSVRRGMSGNLSRSYASRARPLGRSSVMKAYHHTSVHRPRTSLQQYKAQTMAQGQRTPFWPGQKRSFVVGR